MSLQKFGHKACKHLILNRLAMNYFKGNLKCVLGKLYVQKVGLLKLLNTKLL